MRSEHAYAKITRPVSWRVYRRNSLFGRLDPKPGRSVVYVSAPAGAGKTTLVASYLDDRSLPCIWYRVDRGDDDIATFFHYMGIAVKKAAPGKRKALPLLGPEYRHDILTFTRRYFEALFARVTPPFVLVLDNYHEVPEHSPFHDVIKNGIEMIPAGVSVLLVSRNKPPPALARARANGLMEVLGRADVRLTDEEARGIIALRAGNTLSETEVRRICGMTGGWAAGLVLLLERRGAETPGAGPEGRLSPAGVFDYFAEEIFDATDVRTRNFLIKVAFLAEMTPRTAGQLTGNDDAGKILARLHAGNYFIERLQRPEPVFRCHPLFREFLLGRAREEYTAAEIAAIRRHSASLLEQTGNIEEAAALHIEGGEWISLAALAAGQARAMVAQGRGRTLGKWISALPDHIVAETPWLLYWNGVCRMADAPAAGRPFFERAYRLFRKREDRDGALMSWAGVVETYLHELGDLRPLDRWISILEEMLGGGFSFPSAEVEAFVTPRMFGALAVRKPWHPRFGAWREKTLACLDTCPDVPLKILAGFYLHTSSIWQGDYPRAEDIYRRLRHVAGAGGASPLAGITLRMAGTWSWLSASFDASFRSMSEGLDMATHTGVRIWDYLLMVQGVAASLSSGNTDRAGDLLAGMGGVEDNGRLLDRFYYHYETSWYFYLKGDLPHALAHQKRALGFAKQTGLHYATAQGNIAMSHLLHERGDHDAARKRLDAALRTARRMKSASIEFVGLLTRARFAFDHRREGPARAALRRAMRIGRERGYVNFSWWNPAFVSGLCAKALELDIETGYARYLVLARRLDPGEPLEDVAAWPWPVRVRTFGRFVIERNGEPLRFAGKTPKRPLDLVRALVALGGEEVEEDRLCDILWPDADGDAAHKSLEVTITRLRNLLGRRDAVFCRAGRLTLNRRCCHVDRTAFEDLIARTAVAGEGDVDDRTLRLLGQALELYGGSFLAGGDNQWIISPREQLRDKFIRATLTLCRLLEERGRWREALARYLKGLEVDDLIEEFHRGLISCYDALGYRDRALAAYRRCVETLASRGLVPSPDTERLHATVLKTHPEG